jgi:hypothetical protein
LAATAEAWTILHRHHISVGDFSPKNLLFALSPDPRVYFIDCDAMRFDGGSVATQSETPDWDVRAANPGEELATEASDAYKLGLLALRLLTGDQSTRDPARLPKRVPAPVRRLMAAALGADPTTRPSPADWQPALTAGAETGSTTTPPGLKLVTAAPTTSAQPTTPQKTPTPIAAQDSTAARRRRPRRRRTLITLGALAAVAAAAAAIVFVRGGSRPPPITLPFTGLRQPWDIAVDSTGAVYVADADEHTIVRDRVLKLTAGTNTQTQLPFTDVKIRGIAVDTAGNVYVTDISNNRVLKLAPGATTPTQLPFTFAKYGSPEGVAVDSAGDVYVIESEVGGGGILLKLAPGAAGRSSCRSAGSRPTGSRWTPPATSTLSARWRSCRPAQAPRS